MKGSIEMGTGVVTGKGKSRKDGSSSINGKNRGVSKANTVGDVVLNTSGDALLLETEFISETDSIHEEEVYYETYYRERDNVCLDDDLDGSDGSYNEDEFEDDDDEEDLSEILQLRDCVQPLEAWGISLTGKLGLCPNNSAADTESVDAAFDMGVDFDGNSGSVMLEQEDGDAGEDEDEDDTTIMSTSMTIKASNKVTKPNVTSREIATRCANGKRKHPNSTQETPLEDQTVSSTNTTPKNNAPFPVVLNSELT